MDVGELIIGICSGVISGGISAFAVVVRLKVDMEWVKKTLDYLDERVKTLENKQAQ